MARGTSKADMFTFLRDMNLTLTDEKPMSGSAYRRALAEMTTKMKVELPKINDMIERLVPKTGDKDGYRGFFATASAAINKLALLRRIHGAGAYDAVAQSQIYALGAKSDANKEGKGLARDSAQKLLERTPLWERHAEDTENEADLNRFATRIDTLTKIMIGAAPGNAIDTVRQLAAHANEFTPPGSEGGAGSYRYGRMLGRAMQRMADDIETNLKRIYTIPNG